MSTIKITATSIKVMAGEDIGYGSLPWLVSPPANDNFKCSLINTLKL